MFDKYKTQLSQISDFGSLTQYLKNINVEQQFLDYAASVDGLKPAAGEWQNSKDYMMPQINGLVGRYSKVGEEAFYRFYLPIDDTIQAALKR
jgi:carboxyl-terminal processing protease